MPQQKKTVEFLDPNKTNLVAHVSTSEVKVMKKGTHTHD